MKFNKNLFADALRSIKHSKARFISLIVIIALGVGFYTGMISTAPDMKDTVAQYYLDTNLMDIQLVATTGFTDEEIAQLAADDAIEAVEGVKYVDGFLSINGEQEFDMDGSAFSIRAISLDINQAILYNSGVDDSSYMNRVQLIEGSWPTTSNQCLVDESTLATPEGLTIGSTITITAETGDFSDSLVETTYTIVGVIRSPLYVSYDRGYTTIGNGKLGAFVYLPSDNFISDYYSSVSITLTSSDNYDPYSDEYQEYVDAQIAGITTFTDYLVSLRADSLISTYTLEYNESEQEYIEAKAEVETELAEAKETVDTVLELAEVGEETLAEYKQAYNDRVDELNTTIDSEESEYTEQYDLWQSKMDSYTEIKALFDQYSSAEDEYNAALAEYNAAYSEVETGLATIESYETLLTVTQAAIDSINGNTVDSGSSLLDSFSTVFGELMDEADVDENTLQDLFDELSDALNTDDVVVSTDSIEEEMAAIQEDLDLAKADLLDAKVELEAAELELESAKAVVDLLTEIQARLETAEVELDSALSALTDAGYQIELGELEALAELSDMKYEILTYETAVASAIENADTVEQEYEQAYDLAYEELDDAAKQLDAAYEYLQDLNSPMLYVNDRNASVYGYEEYGETIESLVNISIVFPLFFLIVAGLMCLNTMTRMVEEERTQLGTLKAMGYSNEEIISKYIIYALITSLVGGVLGTLMGFWSLPTGINTAYSILYTTPDIILSYRWAYTIPVILITVAAIVGTTYLVCNKGLNVKPATLMRPKAPTNGKRVFLERWPKLWGRISFMGKVTLRNVFRNKKRFIMAVIGVAGCTALLVAGFGLGDAITALSDNQFENEDRISQYDMQIVLEDTYDTAFEDCEVLSEVQSNALIESAMLSYIKVFESTNDEMQTSMETYLFILENVTEFNDYVLLNNSDGSGVCDLELLSYQDPYSVIITEKLSENLGIDRGDYISVYNDDNSITKMKVSAVTENYVYNYIYMTNATYAAIYGENPQYNYILANYSDTYSEFTQATLSGFFADNDDITAVAYTEEVKESLDHVMDSIQYIVFILIVSAGLLAFLVLFNLSSININERVREIASIKVLGFTDKEVSRYIFKENLILSIIGTAVGLAVGKVLSGLVNSAAEVSMIMYGKEIDFSTYMTAVALSLGFAFIVNLVLYKKLQSVDMVESLKSVE